MKKANAVVGKHFFTQVAPCTKVKQFYERFQAGRGKALPKVVHQLVIDLNGDHAIRTIQTFDGSSPSATPTILPWHSLPRFLIATTATKPRSRKDSRKCLLLG